VNVPKMPMAKASLKTDGVPRDGSSFERAILIDQSLWRAQHCPGAELLLQRLSGYDDRYFDVLLLELTSGEVREVCRTILHATPALLANLRVSKTDPGQRRRRWTASADYRRVIVMLPSATAGSHESLPL
jgi:hypothetical protein